MPWNEDGIDFHPTYEGKLMNYMSRYPDRFPWWEPGDDRTVFWIVGSEPSRAAIKPADD